MPWPLAARSAALPAALILTLASGCGPEAAPARPNLLLVSVDTLRADRLACYGGDPSLGTTLCGLAAAGTRFEWAFAAAPYTAPSVASILTSRYPAQHGVTQSAASFLEDQTVSVAEVLRYAGYTTAAFVSNPVLDRSRNLVQGFDTWDQHMERAERNRPRIHDRDAARTTDAALAWARVGAEAPWFLWVHYQDPHGPYEAPQAPLPRDAPADRRLPLLADHSGRGGIPAYQALPGVYGVASYERAYADEIRFLDAQLARLLQGLDALGEPPAVLLTADHGEAFGEDDYWFAHGHSVGLDQIRVPLLWRPPRPAAPRVVSEPVSLLDLAPTLLQLAGLAIPPDFEGRPLPLDGTAGDPGRPVFAEHEMRVAVVAGGVYYARDTRPVAAGERDRISGGPLVALPPRSARLPRDGTLPAYREGSAAALEPLVAGYEAAARRHSAPQRGELPEGLREQLDALGYLD